MKMNKKAFSLIELVAAIVIMGVLMLITIPNITKTLEKNKKTTYVNDANRMITAARKRYTEDTTIEEPGVNKCLVYTLKDLKLSQLEGPNGGKYNSSYSYVTITYDGTNYKYGVQLLETYGKDAKSYRGIIYQKNANLTINSPTKITNNANSYYTLSDLGSSMGQCSEGIYYPNTTSENVNSGTNIKEGDILYINYKIGDNTNSISLDKSSCTVGTGAKSCTVTLPEYQPIEGYSQLGWGKSYSSSSGSPVGSELTLTTEETTYYAISKDNIAPYIEFNMEEDLEYDEEKEIEVTIEDLGSGIKSGAVVEYGFSKNTTTAPTSYKTATLAYTGDSKRASFTIVENSLNGSYYLWVKPTSLVDNKGNYQKNTKISLGVFNFNNSVPICTISGGNNLNIGERTTFTLSCIDEEAGVIASVLNYADFNTSNDNATIVDVGDAIAIANGYKYNITVEARRSGSFNISLPEHWIANTQGGSNSAEVFSSNIVIYGRNHNVTYEKGDHIISISKDSDSCVIGESGTCDIVLPNITAESGYTILGWQISGITTVYEPGEELTISDSLTLKAIAADYEPPKVVLSENGSTTYSKEKNIKVDIIDDGVGLKSGMIVRYGWSKDTTTEPKIIRNVTLDYSWGDNIVSFEASSKDEYGNDYLDGNMYLWIMTEDLSDISGNDVTEKNIISTSTFAFDNSSPVCSFKKETEFELGEETEIFLECTDSYSGVKTSTLLAEDLQILGHVEIESISDAIIIPEGIKYNIVVKTTTTDPATIVLNTGKIFDNVDNSNTYTVMNITSVTTGTFTIEYQKDDNVESIEKVSDSCYITTEGATTCIVTLPNIVPKDGYSVSGWYSEDLTRVNMPGSTLELSENTVFIAKAMDDIAPDDIYIDESNASICTSSKLINITLKDLGSGLDDNIQVKYGFSETLSDEPTLYTNLPLTYSSGDKVVNTNIDTTLANGSYYLWLKPTNYKDLETNLNDKTIKSTVKFCFDENKIGVFLEENPNREYATLNTLPIVTSLKLKLEDSYQVTSTINETQIYIGDILTDYTLNYNNTNKTLEITIPPNNEYIGELSIVVKENAITNSSTTNYNNETKIKTNTKFIKLE